MCLITQWSMPNHDPFEFFGKLPNHLVFAKKLKDLVKQIFSLKKLTLLTKN